METREVTTGAVHVTVEGTAYTFESGGKYLLVVDVNRLSRMTLDALPSVLREQFGVTAVLVPVNGPPDRAVSVIGPVRETLIP